MAGEEQSILAEFSQEVSMSQFLTVDSTYTKSAVKLQGPNNGTELYEKILQSFEVMYWYENCDSRCLLILHS